MAAKVLMLIIFFAVMIGVGVYARRHTLTVDGYVLGGRSVGPWLTAFSYGTSYFSAVVFVGYAGQFGWKYGIAASWIGLGNAFIGSLLAWVVLGRRTKVMTQHLDVKTMPDFFGKRFGSASMKVASSLLVFVFLVPYTASVYNGLSRLFGIAFNVPYELCVIVMALFTGIYVILGGYMATAINDFIQGIIMLIGIVAVIAAVLSGRGGFYEALMKLSELASDNPVTLGQKGAFASFFGPDPLNLLGVILLTSLGTWGLPQMIGKFYAIKDEKSINTGTVISTLFALIISGGCYFLGGFGRLFDGEAVRDATGVIIYDAVIPHMLSTLPDILIGVVVVLVLSASMSTLASLVLTSGTTLALDCLKDRVIKNMDDRRQIHTVRGLVVMFVVLSVLLALNPPTFIAQLMGISWGALAGSFLAPFLYGLYWKRTTSAAVWASFLTGTGITVSNLFFHYIASPINAGAVSMITGLVAVPLVSCLTRVKDKEKVEGMFACYDEKVVITKRNSLEAVK